MTDQRFTAAHASKASITVLITCITALSGCQTDTSAAQPPRPTDSVAFVASPLPTTTPPATRQAHYAASRFAGAWVRTDLDLAAWRENLARHATPTFIETISTLTPGNRPANSLTGPIEQIDFRPEEAHYLVTTDVGTLRMTAVPIDYRWRITAAEHTP